MNRVNVLTAMDVLWKYKEKLKDELEILDPSDTAKVRLIQSELMGCHEGYNVLEDAIKADRAKDKV